MRPSNAEVENDFIAPGATTKATLGIENDYMSMLINGYGTAVLYDDGKSELLRGKDGFEVTSKKGTIQCSAELKETASENSSGNQLRGSFKSLLSFFSIAEIEDINKGLHEYTAHLPQI